MPNSKAHCSVDYHEFNGSDLDIKAHLVAEGIYTNNPPFTVPPVTQLAYDALVAAHHEKYEAYKNGGKAQKGAYLTARTSLITAMDTLGDYVDKLPGVDEDMILLAGFTPTKTGNSKAVAPPVPTGIELTFGVTGEVFAECAAIAGDIFYGCMMIASKPLPDGFAISNGGQIIIPNDEAASVASAMVSNGIAAIGDLNKKRKKHFTGLTKGVEYYFYFFAVNSAGVSQLSAVQHITCG